MADLVTVVKRALCMQPLYTEMNETKCTISLVTAQKICSFMHISIGGAVMGLSDLEYLAVISIIL